MLLPLHPTTTLDRVAPAKSFDQLEDFNFGVLLAAVIGLAAVTVVVKHYHAAKEEKQAWK